MEKTSLAFLRRTAHLAGASSPSKTNWRPDFHYPTTFAQSLILNCLATVKNAAVIREDLSQRLLEQRSANWSFNYWLRETKESETFPYPDDLDDTFCALIGLYRHNPKLIDEAALARIVHLLLATETAVGGPYRTWLVHPDSSPEWAGVDVAVNANIAYFLQLIGSPSRPLLQYLEAKIMNSDYFSDYYPTPFPVWYYLARVCPLACRDKLRQDIVGKKPANALQLALSICALRQLGGSVQDRIDALATLQSNDGSWPAAAFCLDPTRNGQAHFHGSTALTTAFALEALAPKADAPTKRPAPSPKLLAKITNQARHDIQQLAPELCKQATVMLDGLLLGDTKQQITLLPFRFAQSLTPLSPANEQFYADLGLANLYGWMAYTIYDDFLDNAGQPLQLPVANFALRSSLAYFRKALPSHHEFQELVNQTFNTIDSANAWELAHCRSSNKLPRYGQLTMLANRSLGHSLTPIAVLLQAGKTLHDPGIIAVQKAFRHYLIARQLDDDAHDWQADIKNEHISYVVAEILRADNSQNHQREFWYHTLPKVLQVMDEHTIAARRELAKAPFLTTNNVVSRLLDDIEASVQTTRAKQLQATEFLKNYRQFPNNGRIIN